MNPRIIPHQTHKYHEQKKIAGCGMYTLKNVVESFSNEKDLGIQHYAPTLRNKLSGFMWPGTVIKVLNKFGLKAQKGRCKTRGLHNKVNFIKENLKNGPIILIIGHAYKGKRDFSLFKAIGAQHYMSVRGYNDTEEIFYIYDSGAPKRLIKKDLPIGNITLKYKDLIKYRSFGGFMVKQFFYISIDYNLRSDNEETQKTIVYQQQLSI